MKFYGIDSQGYVKVQSLATLPAWTSDDTRRIAYDVDTDKFYVGNSAKWLPLGSEFVATTSMIFNQASAPTGWTKKSDWAANASIIVGNTYGSGGSDSPTSWETAIGVAAHAAHTHTGPSHTHTGPSHAHTVTVNNHTLTINEIPSHTHQERACASGIGSANQPLLTSAGLTGSDVATNTATASTGGGGGHNHTGSSSAGGNGNTGAGGNGNTGSGGPTTHTMTQDTYAPIYQTMIAASKDA